jgi:hypothetical protein
LAVSHGSPIMHSLCLDYHCPDLQRFGGLRLGGCSSQRRNIAHQAEILLTHIRLFTRHFLALQRTFAASETALSWKIQQKVPECFESETLQKA